MNVSLSREPFRGHFCPHVVLFDRFQSSDLYEEIHMMSFQHHVMQSSARVVLDSEKTGHRVANSLPPAVLASAITEFRPLGRIQQPSLAFTSFGSEVAFDCHIVSPPTPSDSSRLLATADGTRILGTL